MRRTAPLTSSSYILYIYSTNFGTEHFKHAAHSPFFPSFYIFVQQISVPNILNMLHTLLFFPSFYIFIQQISVPNILNMLHTLLFFPSFYIFIQQISVPNILNMLHTLFFSPSKCRLFHNATFIDSCVIRILHTGCAKTKQKFRRRFSTLNSVSRRH
jgi:hypothetical protein